MQQLQTLQVHCSVSVKEPQRHPAKQTVEVTEKREGGNINLCTANSTGTNTHCLLLALPLQFYIVFLLSSYVTALSCMLAPNVCISKSPPKVYVHLLVLSIFHTYIYKFEIHYNVPGIN